jgi:quinol monooxygenase YgiN
MLKAIAQDFIKPEAVEIVLPLYRELVEKTRQKQLCIAYDLFTDQKTPDISPSSKNGGIGSA